MKGTEWFKLLLLGGIWSSSFLFNKIALNDFGPFSIVFLRVSIASVFLLMATILMREKYPRSLKIWSGYLLIGLLNNAIPFSLVVWGQKHIDSHVAAILNATTPMFAVLLAHIFTQDEKLSLNKFYGVVLGFSGVVIMMQNEIQGSIDLKDIGQLCVLGAAISYSVGGIFGKRFGKINPIVNSSAMLICSSVVMFPLVFSVEAMPSSPSFQSVMAIMGVAVVGTAIAFLLYFNILAKSGATNVLLVTLLIPIGALMFGILLLNESLERTEFFGMIFILLGLLTTDDRALPFIKKRIFSG